ncbi:MAG: hypothetical protein IAG13_14575 [Deltaproteobacteria bacterium]|nr:hypothetical protein [Nannocystaceae bacterium]
MPRPTFAELLATLMLTLSACGEDGEAEGSTSDASSGTGTTTGSTLATDSATGGETTADPDTSTGEPPEGQCIFWKDECGEGQKCEPYSVEDDQIPDEIRCCPAVDDPDLVGEQCQALEYNGSCLDTCERGAFCVLDDPDTLSGQCRPYCNPSGNDCPPDETCKSFFELLGDVPTVPLCMEQCDPLVQDCDVPNWLCIPDSPTTAGQSGFICVSPPPGDPVGVLEPCALANQCEAGLVCVTGDRVPECNFISCCTSYCSLAEGDAGCQAVHPELRCVDWMAPDPTWVDVGVCALPE